MVAYIIGFILMIKFLKAAYNDATQPWYAVNADALDMFDKIGLYYS